MDEPGDATSPETQADIDELAVRRSQALGRPVAVATFVTSGRATVFDYENVDGAPFEEGEWVEVADVPVTPSPPPA